MRSSPARIPHRRWHRWRWPRLLPQRRAHPCRPPCARRTARRGFRRHGQNSLLVETRVIRCTGTIGLTPLGLLSYISRRFLISYLCSLHTESLAQFGVVSYQDTYLDVSCVYPDVSQIYLKCSAIFPCMFCSIGSASSQRAEAAPLGRAGRGSVGCRVLGSRSSARGMPSPCKVRQRRSCHSVCCCRAAAGCSAAHPRSPRASSSARPCCAT